MEQIEIIWGSRRWIYGQSAGKCKLLKRVRCKQKAQQSQVQAKRAQKSQVVAKRAQNSQVVAKSSKQLQAKKVKPKIEEHCRVADVADDDDIV